MEGFRFLLDSVPVEESLSFAAHLMLKQKKTIYKIVFCAVVNHRKVLKLVVEVLKNQMVIVRSLITRVRYELRSGRIEEWLWACVVTFTVGGLSVLNAIAGAYSEKLHVICIVGGPNSNDYGNNIILHHTIGLSDFTHEIRCFQTITCTQAVGNNLDDAHELIDTTISTALKETKSVYISINCNLPGIPHPTFCREPMLFFLAPEICATKKLMVNLGFQTTKEDSCILKEDS
ncbi:hypothetical protein Dsin_022445 [Dipteronia sinensis]|uniref:pyruvate decarboxylase n=1 Tax=Dipteronia sinensis TaxID=43782 RepID=A0AAE0DZS2_9ROSI|nr:hypothetical protein Dsin_022445 [Dipteronia sinensis]